MAIKPWWGMGKALLLHLRRVPSQSPSHRPQQGAEGYPYDLHQVIWFRSAAPGPDWKNSLREARALCEQKESPSRSLLSSGNNHFPKNGGRDPVGVG